MVSRRGLLGAVAAGSLMYPAVTTARAARAPREPYFPNVILKTHEGKPVRFYDDLVKGRIVMFNMMYSVCTNICPPSTANLRAVQQALGPRVGRDIFMYSITLQPDIDSPAVLRDYMQQYNIQPGWTFLTGNRTDVDLIRRKLGFFDPDPSVDANLKEHTGMIRVGHDGLDRWAMAPALATPRSIIRLVSDFL